MDSCHCHNDALLTRRPHNIPWATQRRTHITINVKCITLHPLLPSASDSGHHTRTQIHSAQTVIHRVRNDKVVATFGSDFGRQKRKTTWLTEARGLRIPIDQATMSATNPALNRHTICSHHHKAVILGIGNNKAATGEPNRL